MKKKTPLEKFVTEELQHFTGQDGELMVAAAFRYCLGRRSYIVGTCIGWLKRNWVHVPLKFREIIIRDTVEFIMTAAEDCDTSDWQDFAEWAWKRLDNDSKEYVKLSVSYKGKPFPLK